jgi:hypothetical protein
MASGIVPGHHLLLHLINPRIRYPTRQGAAFCPKFAKVLLAAPFCEFRSTGGREVGF